MPLSRDRVFPAKCNTDSVALEPVVEADDLKWLQDILREFVEKTGSKVAENILKDWPASVKDFVKVRTHVASIHSQ